MNGATQANDVQERKRTVWINIRDGRVEQVGD